MARLNKLFLLLPLLALLLVLGCGGQSSSTGTSKSDASGPKLAPDFTTTTLTNETVSFASLKGSPIVLNFAASWCGPCELEAPVLALEYSIYKDRVKFFGLAVKDDPESQRAFAEKHGLQFPIGMDPNGKIVYDYQRAAKVSISGIPTTFFIDKEGVIKDFFIGPLSQKTFEEKIKSILPEPGAAQTTTAPTNPSN